MKNKLTKFAEEELQGLYEDNLNEIKHDKKVVTTEWLLTNHLALQEGDWYKEYCPITVDNYHKVDWKYLEKKFKFFVSNSVNFEEYK